MVLGGLGGAENWPLPAGYLQTFGPGPLGCEALPQSAPMAMKVMEPAEGLGTPRESDLEASGGCITELPEDWGSRETDSWGRRKDLVHTGAQGEGAASPQEADPDLLWCLLRSGVDRGLPWGQGPCIHWVQVLRREAAITALAPARVVLQAKQQRREQPAHQQKTGLKGLLSVALPIRTRARSDSPMGISRLSQ